MNNKDVTIGIKADTSQAQNSMKKLGTTTKKTGGVMSKIGKGIGTAFTAIAVGITAAVAGVAVLWKSFQKSMKLWQEQAKAVRGMNVALKNSGQDVKALSKDYQNFASQLQKDTGVGDEFTLGLIKQATQMGISQDKMKDVIRTTVDMKDAGIGTKMALQGMAQILQGEGSSALDRYVPKLKEWRKQGLSNTDMMNKLSKTFKGQASEMNKAMGGMRRLESAWGDFQETAGKGFQEGIEPLIHNLTIVIEELGSMEKLGWAFGKSFSVVIESVMVLVRGLGFVKNMMENISNIGANDRIARNIAKRNRLNKKYLKISKQIQTLELRASQGQQEGRRYNILQTQIANLEKRKSKTLKDMRSIDVVYSDKQLKGSQDMIKAFENIGKEWGLLQKTLNQKYIPKIDTSKYISGIKQMGDSTEKVKKEVAKMASDWERVNAQIDYGHLSLKEGLPLLTILHQLDKDRADALKGKNDLTEDEIKLLAQVKEQQERISELELKGKVTLQEVQTELTKITDLVSRVGKAFGGEVNEKAQEFLGILGDVGTMLQSTGEPTTMMIGSIIKIGSEIGKVVDMIFESSKETTDWTVATEKQEVAAEKVKNVLEKYAEQLKTIGLSLDYINEKYGDGVGGGLDAEGLAKSKVELEGMLDTLLDTQKAIAGGFAIDASGLVQDTSAVNAGIESLTELEQSIADLQATSETIDIKEWWSGAKTIEESDLANFNSMVRRAHQLGLITREHTEDLLESARTGTMSIHTKLDAFNDILTTQARLTTTERENLQALIANSTEILKIQKQIAGVKSDIADYTRAENEEGLREELEKLSAVYNYQKELGADLTENLETQIEALEALVDIEDDVIEKLKLQTELERKRKELNQDIEASMNGQLNASQKMMMDALKQQIELGILDVANIADFNTIATALQGVGLSGMGLASQLGGLGISGLTAHQLEAITVNITNNQAGADLLGRQSANHIANIIAGVV